MSFWGHHTYFDYRTLHGTAGFQILATCVDCHSCSGETILDFTSFWYYI